MAIAHDNDSSASSGWASSLEWSHTNTGSDLGIFVVATVRSSSITVDSVTYNAVGLTKEWDSSGTGATSTGWHYPDGSEPPSGSNTVLVTFSANGDIAAGAVSLTGVNTSNPTDTGATATGYGATATVDVTSASGDWVIDGVCHGGSASVGAGQTERWNAGKGASSTEAGSASVTMSWTVTEGWWATGGMSINPAAAAGNAPTGVFYGPLVGSLGGPL